MSFYFSTQVCHGFEDKALFNSLLSFPFLTCEGVKLRRLVYESSSLTSKGIRLGGFFLKKAQNYANCFLHIPYTFLFYKVDSCVETHTHT